MPMKKVRREPKVSQLLKHDLNEAKSGVRELYSQAASLSGLHAATDSPEKLLHLTEKGFEKVSPKRRPNAVANLLRVIAAALDDAQAEGRMTLREENVDAGLNKVCPVFPFD